VVLAELAAGSVGETATSEPAATVGSISQCPVKEIACLRREEDPGALFRPDGTSLTSSSSCASSFNLATHTLPTTGTYTITSDPDISTGSLTLTVTSP
jgi:hypothetical protein